MKYNKPYGSKKIHKEVFFIKILFKVFDFETSGIYPPPAVLSVSLRNYMYDTNMISNNIKDKFKLINLYERFYYFEKDKGYKFIPEAIKVNGLDYNTIKQKRGNAKYPLYFSQDKEILQEFTKIKNSDEILTVFVGHNIDFDEKCLPEKLDFKICTMKLNKKSVGAKGKNEKTLKNPTLEETAIFYKINFDPKLAHGAHYDTLITTKILINMLTNDDIGLKEKINEFKESLKKDRISLIDSINDTIIIEKESKLNPYDFLITQTANEM